MCFLKFGFDDFVRIGVIRAMQIVVLATEAQKEELVKDSQTSDTVVWINTLEELQQHASADVLVDLLFADDGAHMSAVRNFSGTVIINAVAETLQNLNITATRINAWPGFLQGQWIEGATNNESSKLIVEEVFAVFGKNVQWLPDDPGFVSARIISMIINEAYLALEEGVSTKEEINTAMKLGTNYPYGPFEWGEKIGLQNVAALLKKLGEARAHYLPSRRMLSE